jgi:hypothetical protein
MDLLISSSGVPPSGNTSRRITVRNRNRRRDTFYKRSWQRILFWTIFIGRHNSCPRTRGIPACQRQQKQKILYATENETLFPLKEKGKKKDSPSDLRTVHATHAAITLEQFFPTRFHFHFPLTLHVQRGVDRSIKMHLHVYDVIKHYRILILPGYLDPPKKYTSLRYRVSTSNAFNLQSSLVVANYSCKENEFHGEPA